MGRPTGSTSLLGESTVSELKHPTADGMGQKTGVYATRMRATPATTSSLLETCARGRWRELRLHPGVSHVPDF